MVNREENKLSLRQNTVNGQRLMRSEIERSMHLVLRRTEEIPKEKEHLDINNPLYSRVVNQCTDLSNQNFIPIFWRQDDRAHRAGSLRHEIISKRNKLQLDPLRGAFKCQW